MGDKKVVVELRQKTKPTGLRRLKVEDSKVWAIPKSASLAKISFT